MSSLWTRTPGIHWQYRPDNSLSGLDAVPCIDRLVYLLSRFTDYDEYFNLWPTGQIMGGYSPMTQSGIVPSRSYDPYQQASNWTGHLGWKTFSGITRDTNSAALGSVVVQLFRTSDDFKMDERTSDVNTGGYSVYSSDTGNHFIVAYKAGSPDVTGATVNTLTGV